MSASLRRRIERAASRASDREERDKSEAIRFAWGAVLLIADAEGRPQSRSGIEGIAEILATIEDDCEDEAMPELSRIRAHRGARYLRDALATVPENEPEVMQAVFDVLAQSL